MLQVLIFTSFFALLTFWQLRFVIEFKKDKPSGFVKKTKEEYILYHRKMQANWAFLFGFVCAFSLGTTGIFICCFILSFLALREFISHMSVLPEDYWPLFFSFYVFLPLQYFFALTGLEFLFLLFLPVYVFLLSPLFCLLQSDSRQMLSRLAGFQWAQLICIYCPSYAVAVARSTNGQDLLLMFLSVIVVFWIIYKKLIEMTKVPPKLKSTLVLIISATTLSVALVSVVFYIFQIKTNFFYLLIVFFASCVLSVAGQKAINAIKTSFDVKSWSNFFGPYKGVIDILSIFVFSSPIFYHIIKYL